MGYEIFTGRRLETLVDDHADRFQSPFFGPRPAIVLQSQSMAQWLKLHLAQTRGGYATGDFLFQDEALRRLLESHAPEAGPLLFLDDLKLALYRLLSTVLARGEPAFAPLRGETGSPPARLFELADKIAGVFHNYSMNSDLWPAALTAGHLPRGVGVDEATFAWQSHLWRELLGGERGTLPGLVMDELTKSPPAPQSEVPRFVILGSAFLSRRTMAFFQSWARAGIIEVTQLLVLPGPQPSRWPARRPWSSWGAFGRAFTETLVLPERPLPEAPQTALEHLQCALDQGTSFAGVPDGTLEVVSAPHALRELEVLRDRVLTELCAHPDLQMHEIAVLAPDINVYAPFLDAAFSSDDPGRHLRHHVIDLDLGRENSWFQALDALLALLSGTLDRPTLFALVDTPAFRECWAVDAEERELWLDYTEEVSAWREVAGEKGPQTWTAGADRLYTGWFRPDAEGIPPLDAAPSSFRSLGRFQQMLDTLRLRSREALGEKSFGEWIRFFDQCVAEFLTADDAGALLSGRLRTLVRDGGDEGSLPWSGFRAFVQDQIAHFPGRRGQLLTEGIHCSSLRPLRAIPFKFIAVLGLDEGHFPRQSPVPSFDLRRYEPGQAASSSLSLDRYTFWETIMAARSQLYLSFQGRSAVDGSERPPSPVLADLLDFLEEGGASWPVAEATVKDFSVGEGSLLTWSPRTYRRALALAQSVPVVVTEEPELTDAEIDELFPEVRASEVVQAFTVPARFHLKRVRQLVLRDEDRRGVDEEEPWSLEFLDREAWLQEQLRLHWEGREAWDVDGYLKTAIATGRVLPGVFSERDERELTGRVQRARHWADELTSEGWKVSEVTSGRPLWSKRPRANEPDGRLFKGDQVLLPRLLYGEGLPARTRVEAVLQYLQNPAPGAVLAALSPQGQPHTLHWSHDSAATERLTGVAEAYWREASKRPLPFYPDYLEALAERRNKVDEPWTSAVEEAWRTATKDSGGRVRSSALLGRDPYARLAFRDEPDWATLVQQLQPWWNDLWLPILEAWQ